MVFWQENSACELQCLMAFHDIWETLLRFEVENTKSAAGKLFSTTFQVGYLEWKRLHCGNCQGSVCSVTCAVTTCDPVADAWHWLSSQPTHPWGGWTLWARLRLPHRRETLLVWNSLLGARERERATSQHLGGGTCTGSTVALSTASESASTTGGRARGGGGGQRTQEAPTTGAAVEREKALPLAAPTSVAQAAAATAPRAAEVAHSGVSRLHG